MALSDVLGAAQRISQDVTARVVQPLLILFVGVIIGKITHNLILRLGAAVELDKHAKKLFKDEWPVCELLAGGVSAIIYTIAVVWALVDAGIVVEALWFVAGALLVLAVAGLTLGLGDFLPNLWAGRNLRRTLKKGEPFSGAGVKGTVKRVSLLSVHVISEKERHIVVPYRALK